MHALAYLRHLRTTRLHGLLQALQAETQWPVPDVHFCIEDESFTHQPWVLRLYIGPTAPVPFSFNYVASILPDLYHDTPAHYAEVMLGKQAAHGQAHDVEHFADHAQLVAHLRHCLV